MRNAGFPIFYVPPDEGIAYILIIDEKRKTLIRNFSKDFRRQDGATIKAGLKMSTPPNTF
jgi:hypothetical protein